mmetsp:Transcript_7967/g.15001  ORF Transcript_7967/g.15001 Transcript_7967/m.15001 type:complete len:614 (-) Transcript_7967:1852-3693(-)|eukprot:CAMPEP_0176495400 /NCGR_PEP_ID=MMETSP0200_2-20121128/10630_1 /TAXON_ID=947934 /ORGANISM="Chaetoceros sp., Strain GSL56" /LENGTH=613 /DNA_ID=CAMNT_0017893263 /DNA_START=113 /DNA_END=1954 /DNA_ORIENTATION=+
MMLSGKNRAIYDTLSKTVQDLEIHAEIASVLEDIVTDIETAHSLERQIYQERIEEDLRIRFLWATKVLEEYKAMEREKENLRQKVGEVFLHDLMVLEDKMEAMDSSSTRVTDNSPCVISGSSSGDLQHDNPFTKSDSEIAVNLESSTDSLSRNDIITDDNVVHHESKEVFQEEEEEESLTLTHDFPPDVRQSDATTEIIQSEGQMADSSITSFPINVPVKPKTRKLNLQYLKSDLLMKIFEYMDAIDIVNMAQANVRLYTKINNIFGLGGTIVAGSRSVDGDDDVDDDCHSEDLPPVVIDHDQNEETEQDKYQRDEKTSSVGTSTSTGAIYDAKDTVRTSDVQKATIVSIPAAKSSSAATPTIKPDKTESISSVNQSDIPKTSRSVDSNLNTTTSTKSRTNTGFQLSASVAQSLASKLLPAELSAIIAMRDQLRKKEEELQKVQEDMSDLTAQLEGTISVKDVLSSKLKDLQKKVESDQEIAAKMTRQVASDQEVIAFLDERVQELEKAVDNFHMERTKANKAIDKVKDASEHQVAVLSDMLTYEREQRADQEKEWKNTKKVLIKEVKLCRAQIMALEAERDGFREENQRLKEALMALGAGAKAGRSFDTIMS